MLVVNLFYESEGKCSIHFTMKVLFHNLVNSLHEIFNHTRCKQHFTQQHLLPIASLLLGSLDISEVQHLFVLDQPIK